MRKHFEFKMPHGSREHAGLYLPLPVGPYIKLRQGDPRSVSHTSAANGMLELDWGKAVLLTNAADIITEFTLEYGCEVLGNVEGKCKVVGWWYDTSD